MVILMFEAFATKIDRRLLAFAGARAAFLLCPRQLQATQPGDPRSGGEISRAVRSFHRVSRVWNNLAFRSSRADKSSAHHRIIGEYRHRSDCGALRDGVGSR